MRPLLHNLTNMCNDVGMSEVQPHRLERTLTRRDVLRLSGLTALTLINTDRAVDTLTQQHRSPRIGMLGNRPDSSNNDAAIIATTGFGRWNPNHVAEVIEPVLGHKGHVGFMDYGTAALDLKVMESRLNELKAYGIKRLSLFGESMGGMVAMQLAAQAKLRGITIERLFLDCSPSRLADVRKEQQVGTFAVEYLLFGPATRLVGEMAVRSWDHPADSPRANFDIAYDKATRGISNQLMRSEAAFIADFEPEPFAQILRDSGVKVRYLRPIRASDDVMVDVDASERSYQYLFGDEMRTYKGEISHASSTYRSHEYEAMLLASLADEAMA